MVSALQEVADLGQAIWLDYILREVWDHGRKRGGQAKPLLGR